MPRYGMQYSQRSASPQAEGSRTSSSTTPASKNTGQRRSWISDVREMTPERASELLSTYCLVRLEKNRPTAEEDELGHAAPWERIQPVMYASLAHETIGMMLGQADEEFGTDLPARRARYLPALNKQIDMVTNHLRDEEEDERFVWTLLQIKEHLKPLDKPAKVASDKEYQSQRRGSSRKSAKASSASSKTKAKRVSERVAVSLYYLRAPGPNEDPVKLYEKLKSSKEKSKSKKDTPPPSVPQTSLPHDSTPDRESAPPVPNATRPPLPAQPFVQPYQPSYYATVPVQMVPTPVYPQPGPQPVQPLYADPYAQYQQVNPEPRQQPTRETLPIRSYADQSQPPAVPSRRDNMPPPPPPVPANKPTFGYDGQASWIPPGIEIIHEGDAGEGPSHQQDRGPRIRRVPSTQSPEFHDGDDEELLSTAASAGSASMYSYGPLGPRAPAPARPRSRSRARASQGPRRTRPETPRTADTYRAAPNPFDRQPRRSTRLGEDYPPRRAHVSPEREVDLSDYTYSTDDDLYEPEEPTISRRRPVQPQPTPRGRDSRWEADRRDWRDEPRYGYYRDSIRRDR